MPDWLILMGMGGAFVLLGLATFVWGKKEEKKYYSGLSHRMDVREYLEHWPPRPEPGALIIGGLISAGIGLLLIGMGIWYLLRS